MKYIHYSKEPIEKLETKSYENFVNLLKPRGLWFSVENTGYKDDISWKQWCEETEFELERLKYSHEIEFKDSANLLFISNKKQMIEFNRNWSKTPSLLKGINEKYLEPSKDLIKPLFDLFVKKHSDEKISFEEYKELSSIYNIPDWENIAKEYDGIIIAPYQQSWRLIFSWYHGLDCASGCIWNLDSIKEFKLI